MRVRVATCADVAAVCAVPFASILAAIPEAITMTAARNSHGMERVTLRNFSRLLVRVVGQAFQAAVPQTRVRQLPVDLTHDGVTVEHGHLLAHEIVTELPCLREPLLVGRQAQVPVDALE